MESTFAIEVEGIGGFTFRRRTLADQFKIEARAVKMLGGDTESKSLYRTAMTFATVAHLAVLAPEGWSIDEIDPLDDEQLDKVQVVYGRLREAEETFRAGAKPKRPTLGVAA